MLKHVGIVLLVLTAGCGGGAPEDVSCFAGAAIHIGARANHPAGTTGVP